MSGDYNSGNSIDVAAVCERVAALEGQRDAFDECGLCHGASGPVCTFAKPEPHTCVDCGGTGKAGIADWAAECEEDADELARLTALLDALRGYGGDHQWRGDWYPQTLIADHAFEDHARELAEDFSGAIKDDGWPYNFIDWAQAAAALQDNYASVEYDGEDWWYR